VFFLSLRRFAPLCGQVFLMILFVARLACASLRRFMPRTILTGQERRRTQRLEA
jgi:hypothetical protein